MQHDALVVIVDFLIAPQLQQLSLIVNATGTPPVASRAIPSFLFIIHVCEILYPIHASASSLLINFDWKYTIITRCRCLLASEGIICR